MPTKVFLHVHVHFKLQSRQDNHRLRGDTPRMAQTSKFCKEYRRYQRRCADCAHRSAGRGARGQRSAPARRSACALASRVCVWAHMQCSHAAVSAPEHVRRWAWGARLGGVQPVEHAVWRGTRTGETTSDRPPRRTVRVRVARRAPTRATPPDLDIVLSFLAAHPQSTPHKLIAVCWTGDRRRCSCGDELV